MDFRQIFRTSKKDEQIAQLEKQVEGLLEQNKKLSQEATERFETITDLRQRLGMAHEVEASQASVILTQKQTITDLQRDVSAAQERIRELEHDVAEYDVASDGFVLQIKDLQRDIFRLEAEAAEHAVASARYVKDIAQLQGECLFLASENSDLLAFVRKCATGSNIRTDHQGGAKLVASASALLKQYDNASDNKMLSE